MIKNNVTVGRKRIHAGEGKTRVPAVAKTMQIATEKLSESPLTVPVDLTNPIIADMFRKVVKIILDASMNEVQELFGLNAGTGTVASKFSRGLELGQNWEESPEVLEFLNGNRQPLIDLCKKHKGSYSSEWMNSEIDDMFNF